MINDRLVFKILQTNKSTCFHTLFQLLFLFRGVKLFYPSDGFLCEKKLAHCKRPGNVKLVICRIMVSRDVSCKCRDLFRFESNQLFIARMWDLRSELAHLNFCRIFRHRLESDYIFSHTSYTNIQLFIIFLKKFVHNYEQNC